MTKQQITGLLLLIRSINQHEFLEPVTSGSDFEDLQKELSFLTNKLAQRKQRTSEIIDHISDCFLGNFFNQIEVSDTNDELDVIAAGFNTYTEELKSVMVSKELLEKANNEISQRESKLDEAQNITKIGSWEFNLSSYSINWSKELYSIFEIDSTVENLFEAYQNTFTIEDRPKLEYVLQNSTQLFDGYEYEHSILSKDGSIKHLNCICKTIHNENGSLSLVGTAQDITKQKNIELALKLEKERSERFSAAKDEFMSNMSHEIRTPLNGILGFTNLLLNNINLSREEISQLEYIKTSADILLVIVNDIFDISSLETGKIVFEEKPVNLKKITQLIINTFTEKLKQKNISIQLNVENSIPQTLICDAARISQILFNLISNAVKFTQNNGQIELNIQLNREEIEVYVIDFSVKDNGIGIPNDKINSIFDPFIQTSNDKSRKIGGTGLGLTITKKIIEKMNGKINVESQLNTGSIFTVSLPLLKDQITISNVNPKNNDIINKEVSPDKKIKILLAEDNPINQLLAKTVLEKYDFEVTIVENGKKAVEAFENDFFDLILMDIMMPEMDGYEATLAIRNSTHHHQKDIPIIAVTAIVNDTIMIKCKEIGMNNYISKPFNTTHLLNMIKELV